MGCTRVRDNLIAYISQELPPEETDWIRQHLTSCPSCRRELQSASAASEALSLLDCEEEPPDLIGQVRSRLAHYRPRRHRIAGLKIATAFSVVLLLVTVCAAWLSREPNKPSVIPIVQRRQSYPKPIPRHAVTPHKPHEMMARITTSNAPSRPRAPRPVKRHIRVNEKPVMLAQLPPEETKTPERSESDSYVPYLREQIGELQPEVSNGLSLNYGLNLGIDEGEQLHYYSYNRDRFWQEDLSYHDSKDYAWGLSLTPKEPLMGNADGEEGLLKGYLSQDGSFVLGETPQQAGTDLQLKYLFGESVQAVQPPMLKELQAAKLGQIALFVSFISGGKSRLLIGKGASATPEGFICRSIDSGDLPFISAYRVSAPVKAEFKPLKDCTILGAVSLLVPTVSPEAPGKQSEPDVYLIAYIGRGSDEEKEAGTVALIDVSVDGDGKPLLKEVLTVPAERHTRRADVIYGGEDWYGVNVQFKGDVAGRATVTMALNEPDGRYQSYTFQIDLQVTIF